MAASAEAGGFGLLLEEFVECYELPKWVTVKTDSGLSARYRNPRFKPGDVLLLRTLAVETVKLTFYDAEAGSKREVRVPPDSKVKFNIVTPNSETNQSEDKNRYETISELLEVCPTCFQANTTYDDPYLPAILRSGEQFKFIRRVRSNEGHVCLECENEDGNILQLPKSCKGDFSEIEDSKSYTLKELIELSPVSRKLRFANENTKMVQANEKLSKLRNDDEEFHIYDNVQNQRGNDILQRITGLPLSYRGTFVMSKPELFLVVSPCENLDVRWKLSISLNLRLEELVVDENHLRQYDKIPVKIYTLEKFIDQFECDLPVSAKIVNYDHMPHEFQDYLVDSMDIIIHRTDRNDSVLAKTRGKYHIIKETFRGSLRKAVRRYTSLRELMELSEKTVTVKIMQDVASDFPQPFTLHMGDIIRFQSLESRNHKIRFGLRTYGECRVIKCERFLENKKIEKLKLPEELEVLMFEVPAGDRSEGFTAMDLLYERPELPFSVDYLANEGEREHILPVDDEILLEHYVGDPVVVISPLPPQMKSRTGSAIDPKVEYCLQVPNRHEMTLTLKGKLEFPPGYFQMPACFFWKSLPIEHLTRDAYEKLVNYDQQAYESYGKTSSASSDVLLRRVPDDQTYKYRIIKSLGKSLNTLNERRRNSRFFASLRRQKKRCSSEIDISQIDASSKTPQENGDDEENIYETYDFQRLGSSMKQDENSRGKKSIFKRFSKRL